MSLHGSEEVQGERSLMCLVNDMRKIAKQVLEGSLVRLSRCKALEAAVSRHGVERLTLVVAPA